MLEAIISNIAITDKGFALILQPQGEKRAVPIFIGAMEAQSISIVLLGIDQPRPLTHDLFKRTLEKFDIEIEKVVIADIKDETFFANVYMNQTETPVIIDARPSDAIALALRTEAPIFIEKSVVESAGIVLEETEGKLELKDGDEVKYRNANADDFTVPRGQKTEEETERSPAETERTRLLDLLHKAVKEERYEDAAKLRDSLNGISDAQ